MRSEDSHALEACIMCVALQLLAFKIDDAQRLVLGSRGDSFVVDEPAGLSGKGMPLEAPERFLDNLLVPDVEEPDFASITVEASVT